MRRLWRALMRSDFGLWLSMKPCVTVHCFKCGMRVGPVDYRVAGWIQKSHRCP